jgi:hypothetical protein
MLDTAFGKRYRSEAGTKNQIEAWGGQMKAWSYVGRFVWGFAMIENTVNQLFFELIGGWHNQPNNQQRSVGVGFLLTYSFDLRKKLDLTQAILKSRGVDESKMFKRLHQLHDLRNVITHFPFEEEDKSRLSCDYINKYGGTIFSKKPGTSESDNSITYTEFDFYDALASDLYEKLQELLDLAYPVTEDELQHNIEIEKAISSSDNVVRFPEKPRVDDED